MQAAVSSTSTSLADLNPDELVDTETAARFLKYSARTLEDWRRESVGPKFIKVGGSRKTKNGGGPVRYRVRSLIEWAAAREQGSTKG